MVSPRLCGLYRRRTATNRAELPPKSLRTDAQSGIVSLLYGLLSLKMGEWAAAHTAFGQAITLGHPDPERVAAFYLWRGRCRDVMGQRDDALLDYRAALGHYADPPVHRAARKGLKRAYTGRAAKSVHPDMGLADVITP